ncbi:hypothetical protein [Lysobacter sp. CA199]|uniref:hypothetical protein n=1 Tax=Lysobacter sp. CA199 TaxID=3455608 RepID=UPI003F8D8604
MSIRTPRLACVLGVAAVLCLPACASGERATAARADAGEQTSSATCSAGAPALRELRLSSGDAAGARDSLSLAAKDQLKLGDVSRLQGACARELQAFRMADLYLSGAVALRLGEDGQPHPAGDDAAAYRALFAIGPQQAHPEAPAGEFVMATRVEAGALGTQAGEFVGLWREASASKLYAFSRDAAGRFGAARLLLDSRLPLRSVSYFPAPDSPSGRLGLVQEAAGEIRLISIDWFHPRPTSH